MVMAAKPGLALLCVHAQWQEAHATAEQALAAFLASALAHLRLSGRGPEAALWEAQIALGHASRRRAAGYLAGHLGLTHEEEAQHG